jgi:hypothetical protein
MFQPIGDQTASLRRECRGLCVKSSAKKHVINENIKRMFLKIIMK